MHFSETKAYYLLNDSARESLKAKQREYMRKRRAEGKAWNQANWKEWYRNYVRNRYNSDPEFKRRLINATLRCRKRQKEKAKEINISEGIDNTCQP